MLNLETGEQRVLVSGGSAPRYAPTGHIVYGVGGTLRAVGFDLDRLEVTNPNPVPVLDGVVTKSSGAADFDLADDGSLVYVAGVIGGFGGRGTLVWVDREGREEALEDEPNNYSHVRVSPDGRQLALSFDDDVWTYDITRGTFNRVTTDSGIDQSPIWTPDGARLVFESDRGGSVDLFWTLADGTGTPERIATSAGGDASTTIIPGGWTPDGATLVFGALRGGNVDIGTVSMAGDLTAHLLIDDEFITAAPAISPDGRWMAYDSTLSGQTEIYVQRFPELGDRRLISTSGGRIPRWSPDGTELFYVSLYGRRMFAVPIVTQPAFRAGVPEVLFEGAYLAPAGTNRPYDLTPNGDRFVMIKTGSTSDGDAPQIVLVQNWFEELTRLVPTDP